MDSSTKILVGVIAGVAAGVAIGMLLAPEKGADTRAKIADEYHNLSDSLKERFSGIVDMVRDEYEHARNTATDLARKAKGQANTMKAEASQAMNS
jgi:gas vesicle protein